MFFTNSQIDKDQLDVMISIITMEYPYNNDDELAVLISNNFGIDIETVKVTLQSYRANMGDDYEKESNKMIYYAQY